MNPHKKILNPKNNSPWLLCPSKSFPGKFYYFNGSTGETAWSLSESDKNLKKGTIHRVTGKTHNYPEPFDPPIDDSTNTTNSFTSLKNAGNSEFRNAKQNSHSPMFGQAVFPKYVSPDIFTPNFVWTLTPMYVPSQLSHRQMLDRITHTYDQPIFVQNSVPNHSQLKSNFTPNGFQFQKQPFQSKERPIFDQTANFNPFKLSKEAHTLAKPFMKDEACQTFVPIRSKRLPTQSESDSTPKSALKASRSVENLSTLFTKDVETSTQSPPHKVDNETGKLSELDKNDLRFKLVAKKRKAKCTTESEKAVKSADQSTSKTQEGLTPRKRVTFDIEDSRTSNASSQEVQVTEQSPESSRVEELTQETPDGPWYVVVDTAVLMADFQCVEKFVKNDTPCRLLIPHAVYTELEQRSRGDSGLLSARQLLRKLAVRHDHIIVQSKPENELSVEDNILECCWRLLEEDCHVVLISNNTELLNEAKSIDLECYTLDEIKNDNESAAEPQNDLKKLKITVGNDTNKSENLFMQDLSKVNGLCLPKPNGFRLNDARRSIFDAELPSSSELNKKDDDKLINLTKPHTKKIKVVCSEITNVKDQITTLSIADTKPVNSRTKQIMNNVFWTTDLDNKINQDTSIHIDNDNCNQNLKDKNKLDSNNQNQRDVPKKMGNIDEIDRDIGKLNVSDKDKSRYTIKVSGITKLDNQFNLDEDLEKFCVKNTMVEHRIKSRLEEWVCRLNQTMEGVLTEILLKEKSKMKRLMPPWNLFEAIQVTGEVFKKQPHIKTIIDRFSMKLLNCSSNNGKLNEDLKPIDFMKLLGLSMILIEHLKEFLNYKELFEADDMIVDLIKNVEDPKTDINLSLENVNKPIFSRSEMPDDKEPAGFKKSRTEIEEYLKKHFSTWQTHETDSQIDKIVNDKTVNEEPKVVRTFGKNLNTLKINNTKAITIENKTDKIVNDKTVNEKPKVVRTFGKNLNTLKINNTKAITIENKTDKIVNDKTENEEPKVVRTFGKNLNTLKINNTKAITIENKTDKIVNDKTVNEEPKVVRTFGKNLNTLKISNTKAITIENKTNKADVTITNQPKVIRNVKIIPAFEERLKRKELDQLDYEENGTVYTMSSDEEVKGNDDDKSDDDERVKFKDKSDDRFIVDNSIIDDLSVSDSSVNTEYARAYPLVKVFLVKLKSTLVKIFEFINTSIREYQEGISVGKKANMLLKTELTRQYVSKITERLKNIIARESGNEITLKHLLIKSGDYVEDDHIVTNYKQIVTKYLEQTQILEEILEQMLSLSNAVSVKEKEESYSDSRYKPDFTNSEVT